MNARLGWWLVAVVALVTMATMGWQRRALAVLQAELRQEIAAARAIAPDRTEHERLLAAQVSDSELKRLLAEAAVLPQMRAEVVTLRERAERAARIAAEKAASPEARFAIGRAVPAAEWRNAGNASSQAALETALWAGAGGDVELFAKMLVFDQSRTRKAAESLLGTLPEALRARLATPEQLIAFLAIKDVPMGAVQVRQIGKVNTDGSRRVDLAQLVLTTADGKKKDASLLLMDQGDGWKLVVMEGVVSRYAAQIKEPASAAGGK